MNAPGGGSSKMLRLMARLRSTGSERVGDEEPTTAPTAGGEEFDSPMRTEAEAAVVTEEAAVVTEEAAAGELGCKVALGDEASLASCGADADRNAGEVAWKFEVLSGRAPTAPSGVTMYRGG